jgi:SAM-dependent methyltransferase
MKKVLRFEENQAYWDRRWTEAGRDGDRFLDRSIYPIKYAEMVLQDPGQTALEVGCGLGRLLKHYHYGGFQIHGIERSVVAVERLRRDDPRLSVCAGDVRQMPYRDESFDVVLAFGVYHNLEAGMDAALAETARCLRRGGRFCISMRPDNLEMRLNEWYWNRANGHRDPGERRFHKWLMRKHEGLSLLQEAGMRTQAVQYARNVSLLYRVPFLRAREDGVEESIRRAQGYRLNTAGRVLDQALMGIGRSQFCNVLVFIGQRA